jgi:TonB family protein
VSLLLISAILAAHMVAIALFLHSTQVAMDSGARAPQSVTAFILPRIRESIGKDPPDLSSLVVRLAPDLADLHIEQPQIDFEVGRNASVSNTAPSLIGLTQVDMREYVRSAALLPGEGYTVVLRIEVLSSGEPGRITVATSSGVRQVDQAAIDYARTRRWNAGQVNGVAQAVWIRWGVRLQA